MNKDIIIELRRSGNLDSALDLALSEWRSKPDDIWTRRNLAWVYADIITESTNTGTLESFISALEGLREISLPVEERMVFESICWRVGKFCFKLSKHDRSSIKSSTLFDSIRALPFPKPSKAYSFLFKAIHGRLRHSQHYLEFADWWDFRNFMEGDHERSVIPSGKELMSLVEQAYLYYSQCLLHGNPINEDEAPIKDRIALFLPKIEAIHDKHPEYVFLPYQISKLHLALGNSRKAMENMIPFARENRSNHWAWKILYECNAQRPELQFALLCRSVQVPAPEAVKMTSRLKLADILIEMGRYDEARTEVDILIRNQQNNKIRNIRSLLRYTNEQWYRNARVLYSNDTLYNSQSLLSDEFIEGGSNRHSIFVEFVNPRRKLLYFIAEGEIAGFFRYDRVVSSISKGDMLDARFKGRIRKGMNQVYSISKISDEEASKAYKRKVEGVIRVSSSTFSGTIDDVYVNRSMIRGARLYDGCLVEGIAIRSFLNPDRRYQWKMMEIKAKIR
jgi:hypothetical protein